MDRVIPAHQRIPCETHEAPKPLRSTKMDHSTLALSIVTVASLVGYYCWRARRKTRNMPPGPVSLPIFGNLLSIGSSQLGFVHYIRAMRKRYGPVFTIHFGSLPVVVVSGAEAIRQLLVKNADNCCVRYTISFLLSFLSEDHGMVLGPHWRPLRRFFLEQMREHGVGRDGLEFKVHEEVRSLLNVLDLASSGGQAVDLSAHTKPAIANIVSNILFGQRFDYGDQRLSNLVHLLDTFLSLVRDADIALHVPALRHLPGKWQRLWSLRQPMLESIGKLVDEQREAAATGTAPPSYITSYLKAMESDEASASGFTESDLIPTILNIFGAATDTTDASLRWVLLHCLAYPEMQRLLQKEIDDVIGNERLPSIRDRQHMPYTEAVLTEVLRVSLPAPNSITNTVTGNISVCGHVIPAGSVVMANLDSTANDEALFPQPEQFRPERHLDSEGRFVKPDGFAPFSVGRRSCPGEALARMELFLFTTSILQRFSLLPPKGSEAPAVLHREDTLVYMPYHFTCCLLPRDSRLGREI